MSVNIPKMNVPTFRGDEPPPPTQSQDGVISNNGIFTVRGANGQPMEVDLGTLMMMLCLKRTENLDNQIAVQLSDIQERNDKISILTQFMTECRNAKSNGKGQEQGISINGVGPKSLDTWAKELGVTWGKVEGNKPGDEKKLQEWNAAWDNNVANIKSKIDIMNNDSQMANIKLQNILEKRNNSFEMATKVMQTNNSSVQSTLRNL